MWFRILLLSLMWLGLALVGWLATHTSTDPEVLDRYSKSYAQALGVGAGAVFLLLLLNLPPLYRVAFRSRRLIAFTLTLLVVAVAGMEIGARYLNPSGVSHLAEIARYDQDKEESANPRLVFAHKPGRRATYQGVAFATNELGLRERPFEPRSADGQDEYRVLFLGDSVTLGWGVPVESTFVRRLEKSLSKRLNTKVRTINAGVGGYNTVQESTFLQESIAKLDPDLVVVVYTENDIEVNGPPFDPRGKMDVKGKSPPQVAEILMHKSWVGRLALHRFSQAAIQPFSQADRATPGWAMSMSALRTMANVCQREDVPLVTFYYRTPLTQDRGDQLLFDVREVGNQHGFAVCDTSDWWKNVAMSAVTNSRIDHHPNARGHEILAGGMEHFLVDQRFFAQ